MVKSKRTQRKSKSKDVAITDDSAIVALLGLKNSASKNKKGKATKTNKRKKNVEIPRPRTSTLTSTPARNSTGKTKKSPRLSSARKNPFKTPKTAKSKGVRRSVAPSSSNIVKRLKKQSTSSKRRQKKEKKKIPEYYVNPNRIKIEVVKKIVVDLTKSTTLLSPTATNSPNSDNNILQEVLETARKANNAVEKEYSSKNNSNAKLNQEFSPAVKAGHYHRNHHHSAKKKQNKSILNKGSTTNSPTAKRKIVDISSPLSATKDNENTSPLKKTKRYQPNRKNVKRSPGSNGIKGVCNKSKNKSFLSFEDAREIVRKLELSGSKAWWHWSKHYRPDNIPSTPDITYRNKGWAGMKDWLGNTATKRRFASGRSFLPFVEARKIVQALGLKNKEEWRLWSRTKRPPTIPSTPQRTYKNDGWQGLSDWLGKEGGGNIKNKTQ